MGGTSRAACSRTRSRGGGTISDYGRVVAGCEGNVSSKRPPPPPPTNSIPTATGEGGRERSRLSFGASKSVTNNQMGVLTKGAAGRFAGTLEEAGGGRAGPRGSGERGRAPCARAGGGEGKGVRGLVGFGKGAGQPGRRSEAARVDRVDQLDLVLIPPKGGPNESKGARKYRLVFIISTRALGDGVGKKAQRQGCRRRRSRGTRGLPEADVGELGGGWGGGARARGRARLGEQPHAPPWSGAVGKPTSGSDAGWPVRDLVGAQRSWRACQGWTAPRGRRAPKIWPARASGTAPTPTRAGGSGSSTLRVLEGEP